MSVKNNQIEVPFTPTDKSKLDGIQAGAQAQPATATQAEAQAGLDNVKGMTPLRVAQAIAVLAGSGGGEANTASNLGAGTGIFKQKTGVNFEFKSLVAGTGVTLTPGASSIIIDVSAGGISSTDQLAEGSTNKYYTDARVVANSAVAANTAKVSATGSVNTHSDVEYASPSNGQVLAWNSANARWENSTVSGGSGEVNTASNVGSTSAGTAGVFKAKNVFDLQFRRLVAGTNVTITENTNDITIAATASGGGSGHETQYLSFDGGNVVIKASGTAADLALVSVAKVFDVAAVSRLTLNRPTTVQYHSATITFTSAETTGRTEVRLECPDPNGATLISKAIRPIAFRLNASSSVAATGGTITLTGSTITLAHTGYTSGAEQRMVVQF